MMISNCSRQFQMNERNSKVTKSMGRLVERTNHETRQTQNVLLLHVSVEAIRYSPATDHELILLWRNPTPSDIQLKL